MSGGTDLLIGIIVEIVIAAICLGVIYRFWGNALGIPKPNKIQPFQRGVLMKGESVLRILEPGTHWVSPKRTILLCDTRPKPFQLNLQDVQIGPETWIRVSMHGATRIVDPAKYVTASSDSLTTLYTELRRVLTVAAKVQRSYGSDEDRLLLAAQMGELLERQASTLGLSVSSLDIWEVMALHPPRIEKEELLTLPVQ